MENKPIVLPTTKAPALSKNPKKLVMFSLPKTGKTELIAGLDDCLIIDLEDGSDAFTAMRYKCNTVEEILQLCNAMKEADKKYKYIAIDTVTKLEELCIPLAGQLYKATAPGKNFDLNKNILDLADGGGYRFLWQAVKLMISQVEKYCDVLILSGHVKDKYLTKAGIEVSSKDLDLTGKLKTIICANVDGVGYLYRKNATQNVLTFKTSEEVICGARHQQISNQEIIISEKQPDGTLKTFWDKVFI